MSRADEFIEEYMEEVPVENVLGVETPPTPTEPVQAEVVVDRSRVAELLLGDPNLIHLGFSNISAFSTPVLTPTSVEVFSFLNLPDDVMKELITLAKGLNQNVVVVDYVDTYNIQAQVNFCREINAFMLVAILNPTPNEEIRKVDIKVLGEKIDIYTSEHTAGHTRDVAKCFRNLDWTINSDSSYFIGQVGETGAWWYPDMRFFGLDIFQRKILLTKLVGDTVKIIADIKKEKEQRKYKEVSDSFKRFSDNYLQVFKRELEMKLQNTEEEKVQHMKAITRNEREIAEFMTLIRSIALRAGKKKEEITYAAVEKFFRHYYDALGYKSFIFRNDMIEMNTGLITINYKDTNIEIGEFKVEIYLNGMVKIYNLTNPMGEYCHPHVHCHNPCLGNIKEIVPQMIHHGDFLGLIGLMHQYLCSYNPDGPYLKIQAWGAAEDWCNNCDHPIDECECCMCPNCDRLMDECECDRCRRSGDLMDDTDCTGCEHYDEEDGCQY